MTANLTEPVASTSTACDTNVVLYLVFDGVLHHQAAYWERRFGAYIHPEEAKGRSLFEWTHHLQDALEPFPEVRLVLSSSWCVSPGYGKALKRLPEDLRSRFIGGTFHRRFYRADVWMLESFRAMPRVQQILNDVYRRKPRGWLALDDDVEGWPDEHLPNLVACDGATGLSSPSVRAALRDTLRSLT